MSEADREVSQRWLSQFGFSANPFALRQAGLEQRLDEYFVEPPGFEEAHSTHTFLLFAPRGGGKTACRITVERACRPHDQQSDVLAVPYYKALSDLLAEVEYDWARVGWARHEAALMQWGARALYEDVLSRDPELIYSDQLALLHGLVEQYAPDLLLPQSVLSGLRQAGALRGDLDLKHVMEAFEARRLRTALGDALAVESQTGQVLVRLVDSSSFPVSGQALDALVDVARALEIRALYVMVDGLDEFLFKAPDPEDQVTLLLPLLSDLRLVEHSFLAFKFFLPSALLPALRARDEVRLDRLVWHQVSWTGSALRALLRQRLVAFSEGQVQSMQALFDDPSSSGDVDARLVRWANGSPRMLLELGDELLSVHCAQGASSAKLTEADLEILEAKYQAEYAPQMILPLSIDKSGMQVVIDGRPISLALSPTELKLMWFLYQHAGEVKSKDETWEAVYGCEQARTDTAIDSLVFRTRKKIERDPRNPVYLKTVRGKGYLLLNTDRISR
jgi:DNA-binding winged helix-turn-helix (wHTH) protein